MAQPVQPNNNNDLDILGDEQQTAEQQTPKQQTPKQQNNKQASNKAKALPAHYLLTVEGTAKISGKETEYSVEIRVPDLGEGKGDGHYMTFILSPNNGDLLEKAIAKKYKGFESIRLHSLVDRKYVDNEGNINKSVSVTASGEKPSVPNMRKNELLALIQETRYPIDTTLYTKADELREAITLYQEDKEAFLAKQEEDKNNFRIQQEAALLNDL